MASTDVPAFCYAALVFVGGLIGFFRAGSIISLSMGSLCGILLGIGARQVSAHPSEFRLIMAVSLLLLLVMGPRFARTNKFFPAGIITFASAGMLVRYGIRWLA
ncbi:hypothetical protein BASA61_008304 [Batrachochytrium salamandrivorans]|nr:hypothetical protein BASA62_009210 [Batrachochytrium salamandrivorans]KAH6582893.1 hypothetical protein BASA61_008304 [Batrachochytrium salamandrivorans]KAH9270934.1 hypothetical protein BASA83_006888 [Batrachochytrium salamandrivorans]